MSAPVATRAPPATGRDYLSYTQLSTFQRCPLRWHFEYAQGRTRERVGASLTFGSAIHAAAELHYRTLLAGLPAPGIEELLAAYQQSWQAEAVIPIQFGKGETAATLWQRAHKLLATFAASQAALPDGEILGVEEPFRRPLIPGLPDLLARVDLLVRTEDALVVRDFKTARSRWTADKVTESAPQLLLYGELVTPLAEEFGDLPVRLEFVVLTKAAQPRVDVCPVEPDPLAIGRLKRVIRQVWAATRAGHVYPNPSPLTCSTCPFPQACRDWRG